MEKKAPWATSLLVLCWCLRSHGMRNTRHLSCHEQQGTTNERCHRGIYCGHYRGEPYSERALFTRSHIKEGRIDNDKVKCEIATRLKRGHTIFSCHFPTKTS